MKKLPKKYIGVFKSKDGYRWHTIKDSKIVGLGDQPYTRRWSARRGAERNGPKLPIFYIYAVGLPKRVK